MRGCAEAEPEPGGPPNKEDITSPNGFAFVVRGRGISKYSIANSWSTCGPSLVPGLDPEVADIPRGLRGE